LHNPRDSVLSSNVIRVGCCNETTCSIVLPTNLFPVTLSMLQPEETKRTHELLSGDREH